MSRSIAAACAPPLDFARDLALDLAENLRRLMARAGIGLDELVSASGVDRRTIAALLRGKKRPHSRTLHRLAEALEVSADEFFCDRSLLARRAFDRQTNPLVEEVVAERPELFAGWSEADFDDLYSRFGTGGALTRSGAAAAAQRINRSRAVQEKVALVLETHEADLLEQFVELLYRRVVVEAAGIQVEMSDNDKPGLSVNSSANPRTKQFSGAKLPPNEQLRIGATPASGSSK
jgi:transcriptional regulator with XRE-family HTH domain